MAGRRKSTPVETDTGRRTRERPAKDPEAREKQMIAYAIDLAEEQLINGTASSQVITHFLKLGTAQHKLELEKMKKENKLIDAKVEAYETNKDLVKMYENAMLAMSDYSRGNL